ncbi:DUF6233 domain-containing protein [Streptomyces sp. NPDC018833]|uniref:DUF6233 domain-containing protein n=1 Tax=Streptomyces sp. NPDC018833 TaxID=3365053 RepID=UPI003794C04A
MQPPQREVPPRAREPDRCHRRRAYEPRAHLGDRQLSCRITSPAPPGAIREPSGASCDVMAARVDRGAAHARGNCAPGRKRPRRGSRSSVRGAAVGGVMSRATWSPNGCGSSRKPSPPWHPSSSLSPPPAPARALPCLSRRPSCPPPEAAGRGSQGDESFAVLRRGGCTMYQHPMGWLDRDEALVALGESDIKPCEICHPETGLA